MGAFGLAAGHCSGSHVCFLVARCPRAKLSAPVLFQENWRRASSSAFLAEKPLRLRDARPRRRQTGLRLWLPLRGHLLQSDFLPNLASCSARGGETHRQGPCHEHTPAATPLILNVLELEVYLFKKKSVHTQWLRASRVLLHHPTLPSALPEGLRFVRAGSFS